MSEGARRRLGALPGVGPAFPTSARLHTGPQASSLWGPSCALGGREQRPGTPRCRCHLPLGGPVMTARCISGRGWVPLGTEVPLAESSLWSLDLAGSRGAPVKVRPTRRLLQGRLREPRPTPCPPGPESPERAGPAAAGRAPITGHQGGKTFPNRAPWGRTSRGLVLGAGGAWGAVAGRSPLADDFYRLRDGRT